MIPIVVFPTLVEHYVHHFEHLFSDDGLVQFKRYITGLLVSENKTIAGINQLFIQESRNQSSLNRWLSSSPVSYTDLNNARLAMMASLAKTKIKPRNGSLSLDDTLLSHYGQDFEKIAKLYDHVSNSYVWAHNLVSLHYSDDVTDYPIDLQMWEPADLEKIESGLLQADVKLKEQKLALKESNPKKWRQYLLGVWSRNKTNPDVAPLYHSKLEIAKILLKRWVEANPDLKLPVSFDSWYTQPAFCRYLNDDLQLSYVGTLRKDRKSVV